MGLKSLFDSKGYMCKNKQQKHAGTARDPTCDVGMRREPSNHWTIHSAIKIQTNEFVKLFVLEVRMD